MHSGLALICTYVALVAVGNLGVYYIGLAVESGWPPASLPVFLAMFFGVLILAWPLAVTITEKVIEPDK